MTRQEIENVVKSIYRDSKVLVEGKRDDEYKYIMIFNRHGSLDVVMQMADTCDDKCVFNVQPVDETYLANPYSLRKLAEVIEELER